MYASQEELAHKFSLISDLSKALKSALIKTGMNIFITLGGVAGQQSYHFIPSSAAGKRRRILQFSAEERREERRSGKNDYF